MGARINRYGVAAMESRFNTMHRYADSAECALLAAVAGNDPSPFDEYRRLFLQTAASLDATLTRTPHEGEATCAAC